MLITRFIHTWLRQGSAKLIHWLLPCECTTTPHQPQCHAADRGYSRSAVQHVHCDTTLHTARACGCVRPPAALAPDGGFDLCSHMALMGHPMAICAAVQHLLAWLQPSTHVLLQPVAGLGHRQPWPSRGPAGFHRKSEPGVQSPQVTRSGSAAATTAPLTQPAQCRHTAQKAVVAVRGGCSGKHHHACAYFTRIHMCIVFATALQFVCIASALASATA